MVCYVSAGCVRVYRVPDHAILRDHSVLAREIRIFVPALKRYFRQCGIKVV